MCITFSLNSEFKVLYNTESRPETCIIELTTRCNLSCRHCFRNVMRDNRDRDMDYSTLRTLLREIARLRIRKVILTGFGEPLLHPAVDEVIEELHRGNVKVVLNTNGTLLEKHLDIVLSHVYELALSIEHPPQIREAGLQHLRKIIEYIRDYKAKNYRSTPILSAYMTLTKTSSDVNKVISMLAQLGFTYVRISNIIPIDESTLSLSCMLDEETKPRVENMLDSLARETLHGSLGVEMAHVNPSPFRSCPYMTNRAVYVAVDGAVVPCMYYSHDICTYIEGVRREIRRVAFGHVKDGLLKVWSSQRYVKFRLQLAVNAIPSCFSCRLRWYCPLTTSNLEDCIGNSPTCAHCPFLHGLAICPI